MRYTLGRTIFTTLIAAAIFGLILLVSPRLSYSEGSGTTSTPSTTLTTAPVATTVPPLPTASPTTTTMAPATTTTVPATTTVVTTTVPVIEEWDPLQMTPENGYDGSITLTAVQAEPPQPYDFDIVTWRLEATNNTDGNLWGVFAYVERFGAADCDAHVLRPGETAVCLVDGPIYSGSNSVVAWVDAWTLSRQVTDKVLVELFVEE